MGAIVEEDENARVQGGSGNGQDEGDPVRVSGVDGLDHQRQQKQIRDKGGQKLPDCGMGLGLGKRGGGLVPLWFFSLGHDEHRIECHNGLL